MGFLIIIGLILQTAMSGSVQAFGAALPHADLFKPVLKSVFGPETPPFLTLSEDRVRDEFLGVNLPRHLVRPGETLYSLSRYYFVSLSALTRINRITRPENLEVRRVLYIPPVNFHAPTLKHYRLKPGETVMGIMGAYNLQQYQLQRLNPSINLRKVTDGSELIIPSQPFAAKPAQYPGIRFISPVMGLLTSRYGFRWGRMHYGVDLAAPTGTPVKAAAAGCVEFSGWVSGYGLLVKVNHGQYNTLYGHLSKSLVKPGLRVSQGRIIGLVGSTGRAYGSHLHFEVEKSGRKMNPSQFMAN